MYFEFTWGKSLTCYVDVMEEYGIIPTVIRQVIDLKQDIENCCLRSWPTYASFAEDVELRERKPKWKINRNQAIVVLARNNYLLRSYHLHTYVIDVQNARKVERPTF
jgi:hypothetical protein